jgi:hypothetical protein
VTVGAANVDVAACEASCPRSTGPARCCEAVERGFDLDVSRCESSEGIARTMRRTFGLSYTTRKIEDGRTRKGFRKKVYYPNHGRTAKTLVHGTSVAPCACRERKRVIDGRSRSGWTQPKRVLRLASDSVRIPRVGGKVCQALFVGRGSEVRSERGGSCLPWPDLAATTIDRVSTVVGTADGRHGAKRAPTSRSASRSGAPPKSAPVLRCPTAFAAIWAWTPRRTYSTAAPASW